MLKHSIVSVAVLLTIGACAKKDEAPAQKPAEAPHAQIGQFGLALEDRNSNVKPGDDFYHYAIGHWTDNTKVPADRTVWGTFSELEAQSEKQVKGIVEGLAASAANANEQKIHDYYRAFLDTAAIEKAGLEPAHKDLADIEGAKTHEDVAALLGRPDLPLESPIGIRFGLDAKDPDSYSVVITQSGLGLPDRDFYLKPDPTFKEIREKYRAHIGRMLALAGDKDAEGEAGRILALETQIAKAHWPVAKRRERELTYNARTREELNRVSPHFPWKQLLTAGGIDAQRKFIVAELDAVQKLGEQFRSTPVADWRSYLKYHFLASTANVLPKAFDEEAFDFYGKTLNGQQEQRERWKRGVDALDFALGEAVGELYVKKYFPADSKAKMQDLVENMRKAYSARVQQLPWMTEDTKKVALEKLATFRPKIGYPDKWRDYSKLEVKPGDAYGNAARARNFTWHHDSDRLGEKTDRDEWGMSTYEINAYYNPTWNEIVFPAAILQPPFFDPHADAAVNYGAIGGVIGHEMGHGFDDQGAKSDARGVLHTWWQPADEKAFKKLVDNLAGQYDKYEALPGLHVNGRLTLGENIGDLGGLSVALEAYRLSLNGNPSPELDGLSGEQRFFLSWAQAWRTVYREQSLRNQVMANPHSPSQFRVNGPVRNMDDWYTAFNIQPGEALYLKPEDRVHIW